MLTKHPNCVLPLVCLSLALMGRAALAAPVPALRVTGAVTKPATWTAVTLGRALAGDVQVVHYTLKGVAHTARCVPLLAVIQSANPAVNPQIKNHRLQFVVAVQGFDGYTVDFSLPELLPEFGHRAVWLALDEDGKPFTDEDGPAALLAPDDVKPGRWVHGIVRITVIDGAKGAGK